MNTTIQHAPQSLTVIPAWWRQSIAMVSIGSIGLLGLWLQPIPVAVLKALPVSPDMAMWFLKTLLLLNPLILLIIASALGGALAHRVGLGSVLAGTAPARGIGGQLMLALFYGLILGAALGVLDRALLPWLPDAWLQLTKNRLEDGSAVIAGMLYGGLSEEIMLRWGLMSLLTWVMIRWLTIPTWVALPLAIALCALAFGVAHLPAVTMQMEPTAAMFGRTVLVNGLAGAVYGWLYWRYHLEAAMAAHAASHVGMFATHLLFIG